MIFDPTPLPMSEPSKLFYNRGAVRSGNLDNQLRACNATIFKLNEEEHAPELYANLTQVDHPCVVKALGFANRVEEDSTVHIWHLLHLIQHSMLTLKKTLELIKMED